MDGFLNDIYYLEPRSENDASIKTTRNFGEPAAFGSQQADLIRDWTELRKLQLFCDGFLTSNDDFQVPVHKALLATCSPFFRAAFSPPLGGDTVRLECSKDVLNNILDFVYTSYCCLTESSAKETFFVADMYCINELSEYCSRILEAYLSPENCVGIHELSKTLSCQYLEAVSRSFILTQFEFVALRSSELYDLPSSALEVFLESDLLNVRSENVVEQVIKKWVDQKPEIRCDYKEILMSHMRILPSPFLWSDFELMTHWPRAPHKIIVTVGGYSDELTISGTMETYDPKSSNWLPWGLETHEWRAYHGLAVLGNYIYIIGGFDGDQFLATARRFDPVTRCWTEVSHMTRPRCFVSVVVLDGFIYAMGGRCGEHSRLRSCERYDASLNQWQHVPAMNCKRSDAGATCFNGKIYVAGGYDGGEVLDSVEVYDPNTRRWTFFVDLPSPRSGLQLIAHDNRLFCLGGYDGILRLDNVDSISTVASCWRQEEPMSLSRSNFAAVSFEDRIWVIGGYGQDIGTLLDSESFGEGKWQHESPLNAEKSCLAGIVLDEVPDPILYSYKFWRSSSVNMSEMDYYLVDDEARETTWEDY